MTGRPKTETAKWRWHQMDEAIKDLIASEPDTTKRCPSCKQVKCECTTNTATTTRFTTELIAELLREMIEEHGGFVSPKYDMTQDAQKLIKAIEDHDA